MGVLNPFKSRPFEIKSLSHAKKLTKIGAYTCRDHYHHTIRTEFEAREVWKAKVCPLMFDGFIIGGK